MKKHEELMLNDEENTSKMSSEEKAERVAKEAKEVEEASEAKKEKKRKSLGREIIRFVLVGILCTIIDFAVQFGLLKAFDGNLSSIDRSWTPYVSFAIAVTVAFLVSNLINFIFSRLVVFKNVDKNVNTKSQKAFWSYVGLGAGGWLLGLAIQELGVFICINFLGLTDLSYDIANISWGDLFNAGGISFWAFVIIFCIKTLITMVYNYITRKLIIFKAPKKEEALEAKNALVPVANEDLVVAPIQDKEKEETIVGPLEKKVIEEKHLVTNAEFASIFKEEVEARFAPGQKKCTAGKAWRLIYEELEERDHEIARKKAEEKARHQQDGSSDDAR